MTQGVFLSLFEEDGKALRAWNPERGYDLDRFVALLAHRHVISRLRNGRSTPWPDEPLDSVEVEAHADAGGVPEELIGSREHLGVLLDRLLEELSPVGLELFQRLILDEEPIEKVSAELGKGAPALYQWRSRLIRRARALSAEILAGRVSETVTLPRIPVSKGSSVP